MPSTTLLVTQGKVPLIQSWKNTALEMFCVFLRWRSGFRSKAICQILHQAWQIRETPKCVMRLGVLLQIQPSETPFSSSLNLTTWWKPVKKYITASQYLRCVCLGELRRKLENIQLLLIIIIFSKECKLCCVSLHYCVKSLQPCLCIVNQIMN